MQISVQNLGPIKEGTVDFSKKLTVFCGPNGTGKTYMAMLIRAYYLFFNGYSANNILKESVFNAFNEKINNSALKGESLTIEIDIEKLEIFIHDLINGFKDPNYLKLIYGLNDFQIDNFIKELKIEIQPESLLETFINPEIKNKKINLLPGNKYNIIISKQADSNKLNIIFPNNYYEIENIKLYINEQPHYIIFFILASITNNNNTNFFSIERLSFDLIRFIFNNKFNDCIDKNIIPLIPVNIKHFIIDFKKREPQRLKNFKSPYYDLVVELEAALLGGRLFYDDSGEIMFKNNRTNLVFPYIQVASSVKSLASFFLYLKHEVRQHETIIIDEPEMNLHPDNQVMFARIVARLINAGLRFIISTHSDFILREFNTLLEIGLHEKTKSFAIKEFNYKSDEFINKNDINMFYFYFKEGEIKSSIKQLEMDEFGFSVDSIDQVIDNSSIKFEDLNALLNQIKRYEHNNFNIVDFNNQKNVKITQVAENEEKFN